MFCSISLFMEICYFIIKKDNAFEGGNYYWNKLDFHIHIISEKRLLSWSLKLCTFYQTIAIRLETPPLCKKKFANRFFWFYSSEQIIYNGLIFFSQVVANRNLQALQSVRSMKYHKPSKDYKTLNSKHNKHRYHNFPQYDHKIMKSNISYIIEDKSKNIK